MANKITIDKKVAFMPDFVEMELVADFMVTEGLLNDSESALKQIMKALKLSDRTGKMDSN